MVNKHTNKFLGILIAFVIIAGIGIYLNSDKASPSDSGEIKSVSTSPQQVKTIRHGYLPSNGDALIFIAKEEGLWEEEGLNVELFQFTKGTEAYNSLFGNKLETAGAGTSDPATYIAQGAEITIIGGLMSEGQFLVTQPENAEVLADLQNWKGKKIATIAMSNGDLIYKAALKKAGIDWKTEVTFLEVGSPNAVREAVKTNKADGGIIWIPHEILSQEQGLVVASYTAQYYDNHPCCRIALKTSTLNEDRDTYVKFEKGLIKAYKFFSENQNESVTHIQKYVNVDKEAIRQSTWNDYFYASPDPNKNGVVEYYQMMKDSGYINTDVRIEDHVDSSVYKEALEELIRENPDDEFYQKLLTDHAIMNE